MQTLRFGQKLKLPSTRAIKHAILSMMLHDHLKAQATEGGDKECPGVAVFEIEGPRRLASSPS